MDERRLRLYEFLLEMERMTLEEVPEPYRVTIREASVKEERQGVAVN